MEDERCSEDLNAQQVSRRKLSGKRTFGALDLAGDLQCEIDGTPVSISANERKVVIDIPDYVAGIKSIRSLPFGIKRSLMFLDRVIVVTSLDLDVRVGGKVVLAAGHQSSGLPMRLLGFRKLQPHPIRLISTYFSSAKSSVQVKSARSSN